MATGKWVAYYRVSTPRQGRSGLGLEAQRKGVSTYLDGGKWKLVAEFTEVESAATADDRPQLQAALAACRVHGAALIIAKLDRLSRDAHFLLGLQKAGVRFVAADMPEANETMVGFMAIMAQHERKMIALRTREALAAAKRRGTKLGNPANLRNRRKGSKLGNAVKTQRATERARDLAPIIASIRGDGAESLREIAQGLNVREIGAPRGGAWSAAQVKRVLERIAA